MLQYSGKCIEKIGRCSRDRNRYKFLIAPMRVRVLFLRYASATWLCSSARGV